MMVGYYDTRLVALSIAVAIIASYTALDLAGCVSSSTSSPRKSWTWLGAGAFSMGSGIWSMHFIGMLAFHLPIPVAYSLPISLLSLLLAILVSAIALFILRRPGRSLRDLIAGAVLMGLGIASMHYSGMIAMQMSPPIRYDPALFAASVLIAIGASLAALLIASQLHGLHSRLALIAKLASAAVMGLAIAGMHYTAMAAAHFAAGSVCLGAVSRGLDNEALAVTIALCTVAILALTLIVSALDAHFAASNARLAESLEKITRELKAAQSELVTTARHAGMAEIANNVLHNVGNVLTSVNVSAGLIGGRVRDSKAQGLAKAADLLSQHAQNLGGFLTEDARGKTFPAYLSKLATALAEENASISTELESLIKGIEHIKEIVATQQSYSGTSSLIEPVQVEELLEDALRMNAASMERHKITVVREIAEVPTLLLDRHLVLQILVNLIGNAKQAMDGVPDRPHELTLRAGIAEPAGKPRLSVCIQDNGVGIAPENLPRLFTHGFTTRKNGHGFGLHSCALAVKQMAGSISVKSEGLGRGAAFTLELPVNPA
jgi:NO-binding membrane sensor protein with MHYT domain